MGRSGDGKRNILWGWPYAFVGKLSGRCFSKNFCGIFFLIVSRKKNCCQLNLSESLCIFTFFLFQNSRLILLNGFDFYFDMA